MEMQGVPHDLYPGLAEHIRPFLEKFTVDGAHDVQFFEDQIADRSMQCWIGGDGGIKVVCLTEICTDKLKTCHVAFCGGEDFKSWVHLIDGICLWAGQQGCARVRVTCRTGYRDFLRQHAFKQSHIVMDRYL